MQNSKRRSIRLAAELFVAPGSGRNEFGSFAQDDRVFCFVESGGDTDGETRGSFAVLRMTILKSRNKSKRESNRMSIRPFDAPAHADLLRVTLLAPELFVAPDRRRNEFRSCARDDSTKAPAHILQRQAVVLFLQSARAREGGGDGARQPLPPFRTRPFGPVESRGIPLCCAKRPRTRMGHPEISSW
jgi:hypothetical protein